MKKPTRAINKPLRIAYVIDDGMDSEDGVQAYVKTLGAWMSKHGHDVHYLCGETKRTDIPNIFPLARNITVKFNGNRLTIPLPVRKRTVMKHLLKHQYDVVHVQIPHSPFFGARVARLARPTSVLVSTFHILPYGMAAKYGTRLLGMVLRRNLTLFDQHISNSPASKEFSKWAFKTNSQLIPNMVDSSKFRPPSSFKRSKNGVFELVFLGRLVERKGCGELLEALRCLKTQHPNLRFHLTICGKGSLRSQLEQFTIDNNLQDNVTFLGFVTNEQKALYLQKADIAVFPSYAGESFGIVLVEAMFAGAGVVIGGNNPGYRSVLGDTPRALINPHDPEKVAHLLKELMTDSALFENMHETQQKIVEQYDVTVVGESILQVYENCKSKRFGR